MSVETTRLCLINSPLQNVGQDLSFITTELLARPPFAFLRAIIKLFVHNLGFAEGLYNEHELDLDVELSRKDKIAFLVKILTCVAITTGERLDIFLSPAKILSGQEVPATHLFLRTLVRSCRVPAEQSKEAAEDILREGETALYRRAVRSRNAFIMVQAMCRGRLARRKEGVGSHPPPAAREGEEDRGTIAEPVLLVDISDDEVSDDEQDIGEGSPKPTVDEPLPSTVAQDEGHVQDEPKTAEPASPIHQDPPSQLEHTKLYIGLDGKKKQAKSDGYKEKDDAGPQPFDVPKQITVVAETTEANPNPPVPVKPKSPPPKKCSIPRSRPRATSRNNTADAFTSVDLDNESSARDMTELHIKQLQHREAVEKFNKAEASLKVRVQRAKEKDAELKKKEADLKEREERVSRIADNLRRQQHLLRQKEDASALKLDARPQGGQTAMRLDHSSNDNSAAEIKGLRKKLFRAERVKVKRDEQVRALVKRLRKLKALQRSQDSTLSLRESSGTATDRKLVERATNCQIDTCAVNNTRAQESSSRHIINEQRTRPISAAAKPKRTDKTDAAAPNTASINKDPPISACDDKTASAMATETEKENNTAESKDKGDTTSRSVSFSSDVKVAVERPPSPRAIDTPTRTRRVAYMQKPQAEICVRPLSSDRIRRKLGELESTRDGGYDHF